MFKSKLIYCMYIPCVIIVFGFGEIKIIWFDLIWYNYIFFLYNRTNTLIIIIYNKAFHGDIGRKPALPARGSQQLYTPARAGFVGDAYTPANETVDLVSLNMATPVWNATEITHMRDNQKTPNRSDVYIYNNARLLKCFKHFPYRM